MALSILEKCGWKNKLNSKSWFAREERKKKWNAILGPTSFWKRNWISCTFISINDNNVLLNNPQLRVSDKKCRKFDLKKWPFVYSWFYFRPEYFYCDLRMLSCNFFFSFEKVWKRFLFNFRSLVNNWSFIVGYWNTLKNEFCKYKFFLIAVVISSFNLLFLHYSKRNRNNFFFAIQQERILWKSFLFIVHKCQNILKFFSESGCSLYFFYWNKFSSSFVVTAARNNNKKSNTFPW